ncbi:MDR family MFS transporter [Streptomyces sp. NPDC096132]|uniref:MDR family MFS transporter n=1 Tax=Streptomyces sp. NPDC096132 TaxID=3366075 RepID=UPI0037FB2BA3
MTAAQPRAPFLARLLILGSGFMSLANSITVPFLAIFLRKDLGLSVSTVGLLLGSSVFFSVIAGYLGGALSDVLGRTRVMVLCLCGVLLAFAGFYFSQNAWQAFCCNAVMALCSSSFGPVVKALLGDVLPAEVRVTWFSYQYVAYNIGFVVGPPAGALIGLSGGRGAFPAAALFYGLYLVLLLCVIRRAGAEGAGDVAPPRQVAAGGITGVVRGLKSSTRVAARDRRLLGLLVAALLIEASHNRISALLAQYFTDSFHNGSTILAALMTTNAVTVVCVQLFVAKYVRKYEPVHLLSLGALLTFVGMAGFALGADTWHFVVAMVVFSLGETVIAPAEFALIDRIAPDHLRGSYFGTQTFAQLGGFVGLYFGSLLLAGFGGTAMFFGIGSTALVSLVMYQVIGRVVPGMMTPRGVSEVEGKADARG